jgi:hypothetical protein
MFELAQVNIGRLRAPLDDPMVQGFVDALDPINALADAEAGFRWRLQTEEGNATASQAYPDPLLIVNLSVWADLDSLAAFVDRSAHRDVMVRRRAWFDGSIETYLALWWVPAGHRPTVSEAQERLDHLRRHGPTPTAFTFRRHFPPPTADAGPHGDDGMETPATTDDRWGCAVD